MIQTSKEIWLPDNRTQPRLVIIGAGFAGIELAKKLKRVPVNVVLVDQNNFHQFPPLFYQVATSGLEPDAISFPVRKLFKGYRNFFFVMAEVQHIDSQQQQLITDGGYLSYDYLVIATGSVTNFYGLQEVATHAIGLKSLKEAIDLRSLILENLEKAAITADEQERHLLTNVAIVGGGPAGVEMAGALAEYKNYVLPKDYPYLCDATMAVYLIEAGERLLPAMSAAASAATLRDLRRMGVTVLLQTQVKSYDGKTVYLAGNRTLAAATLVWTAGVKGACPSGIKEEAYATARRIKVDQYSRVSGYRNIFAIGDVAGMISERYPFGHPMVAPVAIQQGHHLAANLQRLLAGEELKPFVYRDKGALATIGKKRAVADLGRWHFKGFFAWFIWSTVHLLSIIGFRNKIVVGINWLISYLTYDKANRLIIRRYRNANTK